MTMPPHMNCPHAEAGWCLPCVVELDAELRDSDEKFAECLAWMNKVVAELRAARARLAALEAAAVAVCGAAHRTEAEADAILSLDIVLAGSTEDPWAP